MTQSSRPGAPASPRCMRRSACWRFLHQVGATYPNRIKVPPATQLTWPKIRAGLILALNLVIRVGVLADYRRPFWRAARYALARGQVEAVFGMGLVAHHLIQFTREAKRGEQNA